jgi:hypothetical protein
MIVTLYNNIHFCQWEIKLNDIKWHLGIIGKDTFSSYYLYHHIDYQLFFYISFQFSHQTVHWLPCTGLHDVLAFQGHFVQYLGYHQLQWHSLLHMQNLMLKIDVYLYNIIYIIMIYFSYFIVPPRNNSNWSKTIINIYLHHSLSSLLSYQVAFLNLG